MLRRTPSVTGRTFYPALIDEIRARGDSGISEVTYESVPDILFDFLGRQWILSVKIDETPEIIKQAFVQYQCHKNESGLTYGLIVFLPSSVGRTQPTESALHRAIADHVVTYPIDTPDVNAEYRNLQRFAMILVHMAS